MSDQYRTETFLTMSLRSLMETVACEDPIKRRQYIDGKETAGAGEFSQVPFGKLLAVRHELGKKQG